MRNRWNHGGGPTIEEEAEDEDGVDSVDAGQQYRALNTTLELELGEWLKHKIFLRSTNDRVTNWSIFHDDSIPCFESPRNRQRG